MLYLFSLVGINCPNEDNYFIIINVQLHTTPHKFMKLKRQLVSMAIMIRYDITLHRLTISFLLNVKSEYIEQRAEKKSTADIKQLVGTRVRAIFLCYSHMLIKPKIYMSTSCDHSNEVN